MKTNVTLNLQRILLMIMITVSCTVGAQVNRRLVQPNDTAPKSKPEKVDYVETAVAKLTKELSLDAFQQAVIRGYMKDSQTAIEKIFEADIPDLSKTEKVEAIRLKLNEQIQANLNPEQLVIYEKLKKKKK